MNDKYRTSVSTADRRLGLRRGVTLLLALALSAAGCGQKGPLRLPAPAGTSNPSPATTPASAPSR